MLPPRVLSGHTKRDFLRRQKPPKRRHAKFAEIQGRGIEVPPGDVRLRTR